MAEIAPAGNDHARGSSPCLEPPIFILEKRDTGINKSIEHFVTFCIIQCCDFVFLTFQLNELFSDVFHLMSPEMNLLKFGLLSPVLLSATQADL